MDARDNLDSPHVLEAVGRRVLRRQECFSKAPGRTDALFAVHADNSIFATHFLHAAVEACMSEQAPDNSLVVDEAVGRDQRERNQDRSLDSVPKELLSVFVTSPTHSRARPKPGSDFQSHEDPHRAGLAAYEGLDLVRL